MESSQMPILRLAEVAARGGEVFKEGIKNFSEAKCAHGKEPFIPGKRDSYVKEKGLLSLTKSAL